MTEVRVVVKESPMTKAFSSRMSVLEKLLVQVSKKKAKSKPVNLEPHTNTILEAIKSQNTGQRVIPSPS